jgi:hypothetical protein
VRLRIWQVRHAARLLQRLELCQERLGIHHRQHLPESQRLNLEERVKLVFLFYQKVNSTPKTMEEIEIQVKKEISKVPQLVLKLKSKYNIEFDVIVPRLEVNKREDL